MQRAVSSHPTGDRRRRGNFVFTAALAGLLFAWSAPSAEGSGPDSVASLRAQADIEATELCFSSGTDALGRGDIEEGKRIYRRCFTRDGVFEGYFPGADPAGPPDVVAVGPDTVADLSGGIFAASGYTATQHAVTNIRIEVHGDTARATLYASAVHVIDGSNTIDVAHGTYDDELVRTRDGWKIAHRTLHLISFLRLESPATFAPTVAGVP